MGVITFEGGGGGGLFDLRTGRGGNNWGDSWKEIKLMIAV